MHDTRESWLAHAIEVLRPRYEEHGGLPEKIHAIVSWPFGRGKNVVGQCFDGVWTQDGSTYVTVSPVLQDPVKVLDVLVHELVHALGISGHGRDFRKVATDLGLEGKMKSSVAGDALRAELEDVAARLGVYPHEVMSTPPGKSKEKKDAAKTRVKLVSTTIEDYHVHITPTRLEELGAPLDPNGAVMIPEGE